MPIGYKLDLNWPQRYPEIAEGEVSGVAVDGGDLVYVSTRSTPIVQVYDFEGNLVRHWSHDAIASAHSLRIDSENNIWIADTQNHIVMRFTPEGQLLQTLGTPGAHGCDETHLNRPTDMAITPDGDVFVSDGYGNRRVVHFAKNGCFVNAWGTEGTGPGQFMLPHAIAVDSQGRLYVADRSSGRIQVFDQSGKFLAQWPDLIMPWGISTTKDDEIWACGSSPMLRDEGLKDIGFPPKDQMAMKFDSSGRLLRLWNLAAGENGRQQGSRQLWANHAIAEDSHGNLYTANILAKRAQKFVAQRRTG